ncbi:MAG: prolyl oligopeptidase family serine peptidase [Spirochaetales bacterium]|nr:prolyl oligopeptidase family serine peptidase [Spirochaetales bacterium]
MKQSLIFVTLFFLCFNLAAQSCGDVNHDGKIDIVDSLNIARFYVKTVPEDFVSQAADVNCDGSINIVDALLTAQLYVGLLSDFGDCPSCGTEEKGVFLKKIFRNNSNESIPYRLFLPDPMLLSRKHPMVIHLHGMGQLGNDNESHLIDFPYYLSSAEGQGKYSPILVAPQCPQNDSWSSFPNYPEASTPDFPTKPTRLVLDLIHHLMKIYPVDPARIYIMGLSLGGEGTFDIVTREPDLFAAAVPVCGIGDPQKADMMLTTAFWVFHGALDDLNLVHYSRDVVEAMRALGGNPRYTEYPDSGHSIWNMAYNETELYPWMFSQIKGRK